MDTAHDDRFYTRDGEEVLDPLDGDDSYAMAQDEYEECERCANSLTCYEHDYDIPF